MLISTTMIKMKSVFIMMISSESFNLDLHSRLQSRIN